MRDQPSWTAQSVATEIIMVANDRRYRYLVPEGVKEATSTIFRMIPGFRGKLAALAMQPGLQRIMGLLERFVTPNKGLYLAMRKYWIEDQVREFLKNGLAQVVILGAGFDTLAYRLHREFSHVPWFEIDHPATQKVKKTALLTRLKTEENLQFLACDLSIDPRLESLMTHPLFNHREKTLYIAEGLFAYLDRDIAVKVLKTLQKSGGIGSCIIGSLNAKSVGCHPLVDLKLRLIGEPYQWGLAPTQLPGFLREQVWDTLEIKRAQALADKYLKENRKIMIPEDEYLFTAVKHEEIV